MRLCFSPGTVKDGVLKIGSVSAPVYNPSDKIKVPDVLFYENPQVIAQKEVEVDFVMRQRVS